MSIQSAIASVLALIGVGCDGNSPSPSPQLETIRQLPVGIEVVHSPNPVGAVKNGRSGYAYTWTYATSVSTIGKPLTVVEFGSFAELNGRWVLANFNGHPFDNKNFADWDGCPNGTLQPGHIAVDPENWTGGSELAPLRMLWYFIGVDDAGNRYRGESVVETLGALADG